MNVISLQSQSFKYENSIGCKDKEDFKISVDRDCSVS